MLQGNPAGLAFLAALGAGLDAARKVIADARADCAALEGDGG